MEDLFSAIIVIIGIVASIASSAKKSKERKIALEKHQAAAAERMAAGQRKLQDAAKAPHPYAPSAVQPLMPPQSVADIPGRVIVPTVHAHVQPDCDTHDAPGSLGVTSPEGKDPCHEEQMTPRMAFTEPIQEEGGLTFDWSGENMVKAFVMQEVLTRPAQRRAR